MKTEVSSAEEEAFWSRTPNEAMEQLGVTMSGLASSEIENRQKKYGKNSLKKSSDISAILLFLMQFKSPLTILLIAAAILSVFLGDHTNANIIFAIVFISSALGFWQEKGASEAVAELLKMVQIRCLALRDGNEKEIPVDAVVPGDIVRLAAGDIVPGDGLIIKTQGLFIDEAAFTGESFPVEKNVGISSFDTPLAKRCNVVYMGSHVISGSALILIAATGKNTEFGKISSRLAIKAPETDFERGIRRFGFMLMEVTLLFTAIIFALNVYLHKPVLDSFMFSLALAIGFTPQLLPAIITINLSKGAREMAKKKVIVKRLAAIENFGGMNVLCSDKTGTVTLGKANVKDAIDALGNSSGKVYYYAWLNASLQRGFHNPMDTAICEGYAGEKTKCEAFAEIPYDFIRKRLSVCVAIDGQPMTITKGAVNTMLEICTMIELSDGSVEPIENHRAEIMQQCQTLGNQGLRALGVAYKHISMGNFTITDENNMTFIGFIVVFDPLKHDAMQAVNDLNELGVSIKIITGDNELVARNLMKQLGNENPAVVTGSQMLQLSDRAFFHQAQQAHIFAEVDPNQKERIILTLKKNGNVVGFMGDGINDAAALHAADVGISVDSAVDVAKEAADIVLLTSDLDVLKNGIIEGRKTFANTLKYIFMATSANFGNMFSMAGASLFLSFLPLLPKQILFTNLLTDFPEITIASDRVDAVSISKPIRWDLKFIKRFMIIFGALSSVFDYCTFGLLLHVMNADEKLFQTGWFVESVVSAALIVLVVRTRLPFFRSLPGKYLATATIVVVVFTLAIPFFPLRSLFEFIQLPAIYFMWITLIVAAYIISAEIIKKWFYKSIHT